MGQNAQMLEEMDETENKMDFFADVGRTKMKRRTKLTKKKNIVKKHL